MGLGLLSGIHTIGKVHRGKCHSFRCMINKLKQSQHQTAQKLHKQGKVKIPRNSVHHPKHPIQQARTKSFLGGIAGALGKAGGQLEHAIEGGARRAGRFLDKGEKAAEGLLEGLGDSAKWLPYILIGGLAIAGLNLIKK